VGRDRCWNFFFGPLSAKESIRWNGPTKFYDFIKLNKSLLTSIRNYTTNYYKEFVRDIIFGYVFKILFFLIYLATLFIPIFNSPFPWNIAPDDKGMPWGAALAIGFIYPRDGTHIWQHYGRVEPAIPISPP
jgi:hypothetical protein